MDQISHRTLERLEKFREGFCVSIYIPTHREGRSFEVDKIKLKNLLNKTKTILDKRAGPSLVEAHGVSRARELLKDNDFWHHLENGLAIFMGSNHFSCYRVPESFEEQLYVDDHFHLNPLADIVESDVEFYVLQLTKTSAKVLEGTKYELKPVEVPELPKDLEALPKNQFINSLQMHSTGSPATRGGPPAVFHGHALPDRTRIETTRYFREVDRALTKFLNKSSVPLVLCGPVKVLPWYREVNSYAHLQEKAVVGNYRKLSTVELHKKVTAQ